MEREERLISNVIIGSLLALVVLEVLQEMGRQGLVLHSLCCLLL